MVNWKYLYFFQKRNNHSAPEPFPILIGWANGHRALVIVVRITGRLHTWGGEWIEVKYITGASGYPLTPWTKLPIIGHWSYRERGREREASYVWAIFDIFCWYCCYCSFLLFRIMFTLFICIYNSKNPHIKIGTHIKCIRSHFVFSFSLSLDEYEIVWC